MRKSYQIITPEFVDAMQGDYDGALRCLAYLLRQLSEWVPQLIQGRTFELIPICYLGCYPGIGLLMQDGFDSTEEFRRSEAISETLDRRVESIGAATLQACAVHEPAPSWGELLTQFGVNY
ncbi:hypothetical protein [Armatimonas sp.]|uniref:hypothetical protein n=1 Tax=Armatimonas sp. TaxID=1872638 RepID=UPI00374DDF30